MLQMKSCKSRNVTPHLFIFETATIQYYIKKVNEVLAIFIISVLDCQSQLVTFCYQLSASSILFQTKEFFCRYENDWAVWHILLLKLDFSMLICTAFTSCWRSQINQCYNTISVAIYILLLTNEWHYHLILFS